MGICLLIKLVWYWSFCVAHPNVSFDSSDRKKINKTTALFIKVYRNFIRPP